MDKLTFQKMIVTYAESFHGNIGDQTFNNYVSIAHQIKTILDRTYPDLDLIEFDFTNKPAIERRPLIERWEEIVSTIRKTFEEEYKVNKRTLVDKIGFILRFTRWFKIKYGIELPHTTPVKMRDVKASHYRHNLPIDDIRSMLSIPISNHPMALNIKIMIHLGWRVGDVMRLTLDDIKKGTWHGKPVYWCHTVMGKGKREIETPIPAKLIEQAKKKYLLDENNKHIIQIPRIGNFNKKINGVRISASHPDASARWKKVTDSAELASWIRDFYAKFFPPDRIFHVLNVDGHKIVKHIKDWPKPCHILRAACVDYYSSLGMPERMIVKYFTGHQNIKTTQDHYLINEGQFTPVNLWDEHEYNQEL